MSHLALFLLGPPRLELEGEPIEINRRKAIALMAYLAVTGQGHSRDALATLLWPESDQRSARAALRRTLSVLNKALDGAWLEADRDTIDLKRTSNFWVDAAQFQHQLATCQQHGHPSTETCPACLPLLTEAVTLYHDDFLAGFTLRDSPNFDEWQFFQSESLRRELAGALERLAHYHSAEGEYEPAITYARRWLALDTLHEPAHQHLMQLYAWTDQRPAALRQYQECVRILEDELGLFPSPETTALYERIRAGDLSRETGRQRNAGETLPAAPLPPRPPAPQPLHPPAPSFLFSPPSSPTLSTRFVAREDELAQMSDYLEATLAGQGQVVFITGEAGSGKTALVHEFTRRAQQTSAKLIVAGGNCNAHTGSGDPYLPFREILGLLTGDVEAKWNQGLITRENASRIWALLPVAVQTLARAGPDLIDTFIPGAVLATRAAGLTSRLDGPNGGDGQRQPGGNGANSMAQSDLFEQFTNVLQTLAKQQPLLLVVDDAQWADVASINLLFHLGRRLAGHRILMVVTYRPDDVALGRYGERHPLEAVVNELKRIYGDVQIDLDQSMGPHFVEAILDTEANQLSQEFRTALYRQTQGHPLFTIELLWDMQQRGDIVHNDQDGWVEGSSLNWETLPARVEAVIKERLDRMEEDLRDILTVASVEGERFTAQVLARVQKIGERQLLRDLSQALEKRHRLVRSQGEVEVGHQFLSYFQFSHTLFQQYLYHSLSVGERRLLHGEIAAALEGLYQDQTDEITVQLARHYAEAGQGEKAVDYLLQAGDRARTLYAHQEAIDFYQQALIFLEEQRAYERAARTLMKLGLTYHLAFNFQQARQAYEEGFSLWQQVGASQPPPLSPAPHPLRLPAGEPPTLDPTIAGDTTSVSIIVQLFSGLVELSPEMEVVPEVARSWDVLEGGCKYIFHLRDDVRWSDGTPVTAQDFEYAWKRVLHPNTDSTNATLLYELKGARAFHQGELSNPNQVGVQALDEVTLAVELESPTSYFPHLLTYNATYPVPRHVVEAYGEAWTAVENIVTNGPFRLEAWQQEKSIILRRNPDYQGRFTGNVQEVELSLMEKSSAGLKLYEADRLDTCYLWSLSGPEMDRVRQRYADEYLSTPALGTQIIAFDTSRPPFDDRRVRQAFVMAVDRETLADVVMGGYAFPATGGFVPPGMPGHSPGIALPYDPEQARQLLAEAGYPEGRGFPAIQWSMGYQENEFFGKYLQAQWDANLKINLTWETTTKEAMFYGKSDEGRPHMFRMGWSADFPDPDNFLRASCVRDLSYWRNETYQQLLEEARQVTDQAKRVVLYQQADKILVEEAVIMPYFYARGHELVKPWVSRYPTSPIRTWFWKDIVIEPH